jgi:hypothetical protein
VSDLDADDDDVDALDPVMRCRFTVVGDEAFDPHEITRRTGLRPNGGVWRKGEPRVLRTGRVLPDRTHSHWGIVSATVSALDLPQLLSDILDVVEPHRETILDIAAGCGAELEVSLHIFMTHQTPIGTVPLATLRRIVAFNADFDWDLYVVDGEYLRDEAQRPPE